MRVKVVHTAYILFEINYQQKCLLTCTRVHCTTATQLPLKCIACAFKQNNDFAHFFSSFFLNYIFFPFFFSFYKSQTTVDDITQ